MNVLLIYINKIQKDIDKDKMSDKIDKPSREEALEAAKKKKKRRKK